MIHPEKSAKRECHSFSFFAVRARENATFYRSSSKIKETEERQDERRKKKYDDDDDDALFVFSFFLGAFQRARLVLPLLLVDAVRVHR
jgi:hypothetical protein